MEGPAHTLGYMIAGFVVIFGILAIYLASLMARWRRLRRDAQTLQDLEEKD